MIAKPGNNTAVPSWPDPNIYLNGDKLWLLLNFMILELKYSRITWWISWLVMPWILASSGHQQSQYWLCRINRWLSSTMKDFNYLCHLSGEKWQKKQICFSMFLKINSAHQGLKSLVTCMLLVVYHPSVHFCMFPSSNSTKWYKTGNSKSTNRERSSMRK